MFEFRKTGLVTVFLFLFLMAYNGVGHSQTNQPRDVVFFFDISDGVLKEARKDFFQDFLKVLKSLNPGDHFVCYKLGEASHLAKPVCEGVIPTREAGVTDSYYEKESKAATHKAKSKIKTLLNEELNSTTSIISAFIAAQDHFKESKSNRHYIFLFSDMVEEYGNLQMPKMKEADMLQRGKERLKSLKNPKIPGVKVYCSGANQSDAKKFESYRKFWETIISEMGGVVSHYQKTLENSLKGDW